MTRGLPSPTERPDLYDAYDGLERPDGWKNPIHIPQRLSAMLNPIPLKTETFSPVGHRPDVHALRYEFRHLVNAGAVGSDDYDAFVAFVDASGGIGPAMDRIRRGEEIL